MQKKGRSQTVSDVGMKRRRKNKRYKGIIKRNKEGKETKEKRENGGKKQTRRATAERGKE